MDKLLTYILDGREVPAGTPGAVAVATEAISPEKGLYEGGMTKGSCAYRTAVFVDGGQVDEDRSVLSAIPGAEISVASLTGGTIDSDHKHFNGVMINNTDYSVKNLTMTADGSGGNDFKGFGAGIAVFGASKVDVDGYVFDGKGAVRHGVFAGGNSPADDLTVTVKNSFVKSNGSVYPQEAEGMCSCPWMLGISPEGHARDTMCDGYSKVNYEKDILLSDGWGVLSVDDTGDTTQFGAYSIELQVRDSVIDVTTDGTEDPSCYATYSIGGCRNRFYHCVIGDGAESDQYAALKAAMRPSGVDYSYQTKKYGMTYAAVVANEHASAGWYDGCKATTKYGVMYHKTNNVRYVPGAADNSAAELPECGVTEVQDSAFHTYGAAFLVKACTPVISVRNSKLTSDKGVILQLMTCDDPGMGTPAFSEAIDLAAPVERDPKYNPFDYNVKDETLFRKFRVKNMISDVQASFADCKGDTALEGDFYNSINVATNGEGMVWWGQNLILNFNNCEIKGVISSSAATHDKYSYYLVPAENPYGGIPVNGEGYEIAGTWEKPRFGPPMPEDFNPGEGDVPPVGDMPGGPDMGGMPPMPEPKFYFTPEYDENGDLVVIGKEKLTPVLGCIISRDATDLGGVTNVPGPAVNNGVWVKLENGSIWTPAGKSYLTRLELDAGSSIAGTVTVDGAEVIPEPGKVYTGAIVVTP